ncbi:MAG: hypothetical protein NT157_04600 [Candidatus Micrarchaeota archaeon]|nr:hypothetical protein [Candidatus Micrarchaeota archaeon]
MSNNTNTAVMKSRSVHAPSRFSGGFNRFRLFVESIILRSPEQKLKRAEAELSRLGGNSTFERNPRYMNKREKEKAIKPCDGRIKALKTCIKFTKTPRPHFYTELALTYERKGDLIASIANLGQKGLKIREARDSYAEALRTYSQQLEQFRFYGKQERTTYESVVRILGKFGDDVSDLEGCETALKLSRMPWGLDNSRGRASGNAGHANRLEA